MIAGIRQMDADIASTKQHLASLEATQVGMKQCFNWLYQYQYQHDYWTDFSKKNDIIFQFS